MHSYNKPILPSAIIAFFNRDIRDDSLEYGLTAAKMSFFGKPSLQWVSGDKELQPYVQYWESNGQHIGSAEELLSCYYSSVSVVHFPSGQSPTMMHEQVRKLYGKISQVCFKSQKQRQPSCMKWNTTTFPLFVRKAFTHFASKYETSFNFSNAWVDVQNFSAEFNWSLFNLARMARGRRDLSHAGIDLWVDLSGFVASCLFLKCARAKQAGKNSAPCRLEIEIPVRP